ncbi:MAG: hypothetical protein IPH06_11280 [Alphaproteobacteria bacterium]|nr:hypothetical protein [Alphaproteobacteria bacterium]QQS56064.1 MAG: hypothetical protein IPN28_07035 [Alphaproteobacteria bacterium]
MRLIRDVSDVISNASVLLLAVVVLCAGLSFSVFAQEAQPPAKEPERVTIGIHVNDIQEIDLKTHSYRLDFYVWFRWKNPEMNPAKSVEFMNSFEPENHVRTSLYEEPQKMPDGSLYMIIRERGKFSSKFPLQQYPFDKQKLFILVEDSVYGSDALVYTPDKTTASPITINKDINVPGFEVGTPALTMGMFFYDTTFGDLNFDGGTQYSRAYFTVPLERPQISMAVKIFLPILLILVCTAMVFFVHPVYVEGRLGVVITALLTLVALQLTSTSSLPDVDYLLLTDKVYLLAYLFIIVTLWHVVRTSARAKAESFDRLLRSNIYALLLVVALLGAGCFVIFYTSF